MTCEPLPAPAGNTGLLHAPFLDAARRFPEQLAVVDGEQAVTYLELAQRVRAAALHLRRGGVAPGDRVGILLERSIDAVVALYASLALGAVYVPFDSRWPPLRRRELLESIGAKAVLLDEADSLSTASVPLVLTPSELGAPIEEPLPGDQEAPVTAGALAYILFTSGTTGMPKGVSVSHRAARYFVDWTRRELALARTDRIAGVSSFTFDLSIFDLFATLSCGATLYLYDHRKTVLSSSLARFLARQAITVLYTVPTTLSLLTARGGLARHDLGALRAVMFAGEPYPYGAFRRLHEALPAGVAYYNLYGPTETNVCTAYRLNGDESESTGIPIGRPLPGTQIITLPVENASEYGGNAVELCVWGPSLMDGYWGETPDAAPHWWHDPATGRRAYRTGDICRLDGNGNWIYLGRADGQIKVNGFRIEVQEVENVLLADPALAQCAVVAVQRPGHPYAQLVAYVVLREGAELNRPGLAAACAARLPNYMHPQDYVDAAELPTKVSGKTDRTALATQYLRQFVAGAALVATPG
jgi:amino acid adenylation domain-containing protein